jgi:hypothetical protein
VRFHIPIKLPSLANLSHQHWRKLTRMKDKQKRAARLCMSGVEIPLPPLIVTITRIGPRKLDDDNLASSCKYIRDQIAEKVGLDDGSAEYTWRYDQRTGAYGVDVEITER